MEILMQTQEPPDVSAEQRASNEIIKLIRKLRWIGMEDDAHHLQLAMCGLPPHERCAVLAGPLSTD